jgi:hypothetical protein|nr:MAG TPA: hypothetical protein [Caudoviricetes sp.]
MVKYIGKKIRTEKRIKAMEVHPFDLVKFV